MSLPQLRGDFFPFPFPSFPRVSPFRYGNWGAHISLQCFLGPLGVEPDGEDRVERVGQNIAPKSQVTNVHPDFDPRLFGMPKSVECSMNAAAYRMLQNGHCNPFSSTGRGNTSDWAIQYCSIYSRQQ